MGFNPNTRVLTIKNLINKTMPQLVPFYFMNEVVFAFSVIVIVHYLLSKYILPRIMNLFVSRLFTVLLDEIESQLPW